MLLLFLGLGADSDSVSLRAWDWLPSEFFWYNDHTKRKALLQCKPSDVSKQSVLSRPEASREVGKLSWPSCSASKLRAPLNQSLGIFLHVYWSLQATHILTQTGKVKNTRKKKK